MEFKQNWEGPIKNGNLTYLQTNSILGEIRIYILDNIMNYSIEELHELNSKKYVKILIEFTNFPRENFELNGNLLNGKEIVDNWLYNKYEKLKQLFVPDQPLAAAKLMHQVFVNRYCNIAKTNVGKTPNEIPEITNVSIAIDVLEELYPEAKLQYGT